MKLIEERGVGRVFTDESVEIFKTIAEEMIDTPALNEAMSLRGLILAKEMFSTETAVHQIVASAKMSIV